MVMDTLPPVEKGPAGAVDGDVVRPADIVNHPPEPLLCDIGEVGVRSMRSHGKNEKTKRWT